MSCCYSCFDPSNVSNDPLLDSSRRAQFPRRAHNYNRYPPPLRDEDYQGYEADLFEVPDQLAHPITGYGGMRGVKTHCALHVGAIAARYIGEPINADVAHARNENGLGGMIAFAGQDEQGFDVYIDGAVGGNISRLINHHCNDEMVNIRLVKNYFNGVNCIDVMVCKYIPPEGDLFFNNRSTIVEGMVPEAVLHRCFCKGFDLNGNPICTRVML
jgi:hypothetical protein